MKKVLPSKHLLINKTELIIREASVEDAEELRSVVKEYVEESEFIPYKEGEFNPSLEDERKWIENLFKSPNSLLLVATINSKIVGNISLNGVGRQMMSHTSCIGIGMLSSARGLGIGSMLFEKALEWTKKESPIEVLWLETYSTNTHGLALYAKFGFQEVGRHPFFVKLSEGKYVDNVTMSLKIK